MLTPGDQLGPYCIQESLKGGNMGAVYRAQDTRDQQEVAIKVIAYGSSQIIPKKVSDDFCREAGMIAKLNHPQIIRLLGDDQDVNKGVLYDVDEDVLFNSDMATAEIPAAAHNGPIALISPSNTSDCLTIDPCGGNQGLLDDAKKTYFRTAALDSEQGDRLANYLYNTQHYRTASIFEQEPNVYGQGFAQSFYDAWLRLGGRVIGNNQHIMPVATSSDDAKWLQQIDSNPPSIVFFAGDAPGARSLYGLMKQDSNLAMTPFVGGGAIMDEGYIKDFEGGGPVYAIAPIGDPRQTPSGQDFISQYDAMFSDRTPYSASAYDCTNILIQAIKNALAAKVQPPINQDDQQDARKFRQKVIDELHSSYFSYRGVTGVYSFNGNSDVTNPSISIYQLGNDRWPI